MAGARTFLDDANGRWAPPLPEIVEAAMRCDERHVANQALDQGATMTGPSGTDWPLGLESLCRAREQLRSSRDLFVEMGAEALAAHADRASSNGRKGAPAY